MIQFEYSDIFSEALFVHCVSLHIYFFINLDNVRMISWCVRWYQPQNSALSKTFKSRKSLATVADITPDVTNILQNTKQLSIWLTSDTSLGCGDMGPMLLRGLLMMSPGQSSANQRPASDHVTEHLGQVTHREFCVICQPEVKIYVQF